MRPENRLIWTLGAALLMWAPAALGMISGHIDVVIGGFTFVAAIVLAYIATGVIDMITNGYRHTAQVAEHVKRQIEAIERRKAEDEKAAKDADSDGGEPD